jgi:hypothetical protein
MNTTRRGFLKGLIGAASAAVIAPEVIRLPTLEHNIEEVRKSYFFMGDVLPESSPSRMAMEMGRAMAEGVQDGIVQIWVHVAEEFDAGYGIYRHANTPKSHQYIGSYNPATAPRSFNDFLGTLPEPYRSQVARNSIISAVRRGRDFSVIFPSEEVRPAEAGDDDIIGFDRQGRVLTWNHRG